MKNKRKIIIAGGSGFMGKSLENHFKKLGDEVLILSRKPTTTNTLVWDGKTIGKWAEYLENSDVLINLSGKSVDCRYNEKNKSLILNSRVESTRVLHEAVENCENPPKIWLNASTATIYTDSREQKMTEKEGIIGDDFSMSVAKAWEKEFFKNEIKNVRKVAMRTSLVIGETGGVFKVLEKLVKMGFGGKMGDGNQKFAYVKMNEFIKMLEFSIENEQIQGPVNFTSINDITNAAFMKALRKKLNQKFYLNNPEILLTIGGFILGTEKELILKSRYVYPEKLESFGFEFDKTIL